MAIHLPLFLYVPVTLLLLPVLGTLVRLRAAYKPKQLPALGDDRPYAGGNIFTREGSTLWFYSVVKATYTIEGWQWLFRGLVPAFLTGVVFWSSFATRVTFGPAWTSSIVYDLSDAVILSVLLLLPQVWLYRTISTPVKLRIFRTNVFDALSAIFSPYERSRFLLPIFLSPGLIFTLVLNIIFQMYIFKPIRKILETPGSAQLSSFTIQFGIAAFVLLATFICAPLDVVITRLAVQQNPKTSPVIHYLAAVWKNINLFHKALLGLVGLGDLAMFIWTLVDYNMRYDILMQTIPAGVTFLVAMYIFFITRGAVYGQGSEVNVTNMPSGNTGDDDDDDTTEKSDPIEGVDLLPMPATSVIEEHAIQLRGDDMEPYKGFYDCVTKIISEEGISALYRGWWATFIALYCIPV